MSESLAQFTWHDGVNTRCIIEFVTSVARRARCNPDLFLIAHADDFLQFRKILFRVAREIERPIAAAQKKKIIK